MSYARPTFIGIFLCNSLLDLKERKMKDKKNVEMSASTEFDRTV